MRTNCTPSIWTRGQIVPRHFVHADKEYPVDLSSIHDVMTGFVSHVTIDFYYIRSYAYTNWCCVGYEYKMIYSSKELVDHCHYFITIVSIHQYGLPYTNHLQPVITGQSCVGPCCKVQTCQTHHHVITTRNNMSSWLHVEPWGPVLLFPSLSLRPVTRFSQDKSILNICY